MQLEKLGPDDSSHVVDWEPLIKETDVMRTSTQGGR